jgi:hypothetical protein
VSLAPRGSGMEIVLRRTYRKVWGVSVVHELSDPFLGLTSLSIKHLGRSKARPVWWGKLCLITEICD